LSDTTDRVFELVDETLYRDNPFRRLRCLPTDARPAEIHEFFDEADPLPEGITCALPLAGPSPSPGERNLLRQRLLNDPLDRLIDAFFWFWPAEPGRGSTDRGLQLIYAGDGAGALSYWTDQQSSAAKHNIAVYHHARILDICADIAESGISAPLVSNGLDGAWRSALRAWRAARTTGLADWLEQWIDRANDPRLPHSAAADLIRTLPEALQQINAAVALAWARRGLAGDWGQLFDDQIELLWAEDRWFGGTADAVLRVSRPLKVRVDDAVSRATATANPNLQSPRHFYCALLDDIAASFQTMSRLAKDREELRKSLVGEASRQLVSLYGAFWPDSQNDPNWRAWADRVLFHQRLLQLQLPADLEADTKRYLGVCASRLRIGLSEAWGRLLPKSGKFDLARLREEILPPLRDLVAASGADAETRALVQDFASALGTAADRFERANQIDRAIETRQSCIELPLDEDSKRQVQAAIRKLQQAQARRKEQAAQRVRDVSRQIANLAKADDPAAQLEAARERFLPELRALQAKPGGGDVSPDKVAAREFADLASRLAEEQRFALAIEAMEIAQELDPCDERKRSNRETIERWRQQLGNRRGGRCFFCGGRRAAAPEVAMPVVLTSGQMSERTVFVPCCQSCRSFHDNAAIGLFAIPVVGFLVLYWLGANGEQLGFLAFVTVIALAAKWDAYRRWYFGAACAVAGCKGEEAGVDYPEVADLRRRNGK
jgi:hypothetical protein